MTARTRLTAGFAAATFLLIAAASASAYNGQVAATATVSAESAACGDAFTVESTFLDLEGLPVGGLSVKWSFLTSQSPDDAINDTTTVTDADGVATTTVTLAAVPGDRTIGVTSDDVTASMVVSPSCPGTSRTGTHPGESRARPGERRSRMTRLRACRSVLLQPAALVRGRPRSE